MDRGTVLARVNNKIVVTVDGDGCAVFEVAPPSDVDVGDRVRGNLESGLCFSLENLTSSEVLEVSLLAHHDSRQAALRAVEV